MQDGRWRVKETGVSTHDRTDTPQIDGDEGDDVEILLIVVCLVYICECVACIT